ncbi:MULTISPECIES: hypothetical protein [Sphingomonas]|uniref:hypothetical protein n=1 Tax=Sphingomonas TaxID=13687 RepID=UPI0008358565|nr:hypothetical protein [Sphingomonas sp. CCH10-B3]
MSGWVIWAIAAALYGAFRLWYDNWRGKLTPAEIEAYFAKLEGRDDTTPEARANLRKFLEADDGRDFVMFNIVKATQAPVTDPISGEQVPGVSLLQRYSKHFVPVLVRNGGHPAIVRRKIGPYLDSWATEPDPGWTIIGLMRYRSRRDMMNLVIDPQFAKHHPDKLAGTLATFSFPTAPMLQLYVGPRIWLALVLALLAALTQLALG